MRGLVLLLLRRAFGWPSWLPRRGAPRDVAPRDGGAVAPGLAACRRAWGEIRARYRAKHLWVPA